MIGVLGEMGCHGAAAPGEGAPQLNLSSESFQSDKIPARFTCHGADSSPKLRWSEPPAGTKSLALTVVDVDAPMGEFTHWLLYNIPATKRELSESVPGGGKLDDGSVQGRNDFGANGYGGPCPPGSSAHRYVFTLFALDSTLSLGAGASRDELEKAIAGHVVARGRLTGRFP
jgi:Raf kinase inhibitor-like YbhB/YbcL family protein